MNNGVTANIATCYGDSTLWEIVNNVTINVFVNLYIETQNNYIFKIAFIFKMHMLLNRTSGKTYAHSGLDTGRYKITTITGIFAQTYDVHMQLTSKKHLNTHRVDLFTLHM